MASIERALLVNLSESLGRAFGPLLTAGYDDGVLTVQVGRCVAQFDDQGDLIGGHSAPEPSDREPPA